MEAGGGAIRHHRKSPSSDRFLNVFSQSPPSPSDGSFSTADELNEHDIFWAGDFAQRNPTSAADGRRGAFLQVEKFGILAALPEDDRGRRRRQVVYHASSISPPPSSSWMAIPKPPSGAGREISESMPTRKLHHQSAPMQVPVLSKAMAAAATRGGGRRSSVLMEVDAGVEEEEGEGEEMLPPHEMVARGGSNRSPKTTYSVLEGVGRTLKGRDLRQVRNAVWRRTGFLD